MRRTFVVVEASPPVRPVFRDFELRTGDCFGALPGADLAPWSDAEPERTGAVEADWGEEVEVNVEAARTPEPVVPEPVEPEPVVPESTGAAVLTGEAVDAVRGSVDVAPASLTWGTL